MTELTNCELCLYCSAGAVSCDCVTVCSLLLALSEIWKLWLRRAWKIMLNCTWWIQVSVSSTGTLQLPVCNSMYGCDTSVVRLCDSEFWVLSQNFEKQLLTLSCLCVYMQQLSSHWTDFHEFWSLCFFSKNVLRKFMFRYNRWRTVGTLHEHQYTVLVTSHSVLVIMRTVGYKNCRQSENTHFILNNLFYWGSCHLWGNVEMYCGPEQAPCDNWAHDHCRLDT